MPLARRYHWRDKYRLEVLQEIYRVLSPHGVFVNGDKIAEPRPRHDEVLLEQIRLCIDAYAKENRPDLLRAWVVHYLEDNISGVLWFEAEAIEQLKQVGFKSVKKPFDVNLKQPWWRLGASCEELTPAAS